MNELELFEKIEDFLKKRLTPEARQAFEAEIAADPQLAETVALHRDMLEATVPADVLNLRRLMEETYQAESGRQQKKKDGGFSFTLGRGMRWAAAASVLLVVAAGVWWMQRTPVMPMAHVPPTTIDSTANVVQSPAKPDTATTAPDDKTLAKRPAATPDYAALAGKAYAESPYAPGILMNGEGEESPGAPMQKAAEAYTQNRFAEVVQLLETLPDDGRTEALKLRAHARFRLKRYDAAAADFEELTKSFSYRNDAKWFLLLCHAARLPATKTAYEGLLKELTTPGNPFEKKAIALKARISY